MQNRFVFKRYTIEAKTRPYTFNRFVATLNQIIAPFYFHTTYCDIVEDTLLTLAGINHKPQKKSFFPLDAERICFSLDYGLYGMPETCRQQFISYLQKLIGKENVEYNNPNQFIVRLQIFVEKFLPLFKEHVSHRLSETEIKSYQVASLRDSHLKIRYKINELFTFIHTIQTDPQIKYLEIKLDELQVIAHSVLAAAESYYLAEDAEDKKNKSNIFKTTVNQLVRQYKVDKEKYSGQAPDILLPLSDTIHAIEDSIPRERRYYVTFKNPQYMAAKDIAKAHAFLRSISKNKLNIPLENKEQAASTHRLIASFLADKDKTTAKFGEHGKVIYPTEIYPEEHVVRGEYEK